MMDNAKKLFTVYEIISITGGEALSRPNPGSCISSVQIDSRKVQYGTLFIALHGEKTDGHKYLRNAINAGATTLLVDKACSNDFSQLLSEYPSVSVIGVRDTLKSLQKLAAAWVERNKSLKKVAVTGSSGKTTTKEMISSILSRLGQTVKNPGNYNSDIGLPLSVFRISEDHEFGVFEMGINKIGEMDTLLSIYEPDYSIMTNIGTAHIGRLGSIEAIAREKSKIYHTGVKHGYIHEENIWKSYLRNLRGLEFREFGRKGTKGFKGAEYLGLQGWRIHYEDRTFCLKHVGIHNLLDALAAITIARDLGAESGHIAEGLESLEPLSGRSKVINGKVTIIEDSYNSNLDSASRIIDYVKDLHWEGRKTVVLGSMKELGAACGKSHEAIGRKVKSLAPSAAFLFGNEMESAYKLLKNENYTNKLVYTDCYEELESEVTTYTHDGDLLLLKGSRSMEMERLLVPLSMVS
ncbi:MAG: UDP-N-acetylmuramoyl-tripeptide--D-alanyl-D-alanine ligase [Spirochaetales bacterium]|nr:UDP-N-acetylmuramoyl-tripeptide--D-alanyl-D-alanine ligase [Spirochaetales bacterium]